ncbi:MAG: DNA cytosine methyltransferase, partial [Acetanaerobacterium sp.]
DETLSVPLPEKRTDGSSGKWSTAGEIVGDGFSIGWRTLDAQFWGVAQRRRRCYIVVDFTCERAGKILFDESRLRGHPPQGGFPWQAAAGSAETCAGIAVCFEPGACSRLGGHVWHDAPVGALRADMGDNQTAVAIENYPADSRVKLSEAGVVQTLSERMGTGGGNTPMVITAFGICSHNSNSMLSPNPHSGIYKAETSRTLDLNCNRPDCNQGGVAVVAVQGSMIGREDKNGPQGSGIKQDVSFTLDTADRHAVAYAMTTGEFTQVCPEKSPCLQARDYKDPPVVSQPPYVVRRLTPTECALLQGFPPDWCAGLDTSDPTEDDVAFWTDIWETHRVVMGTSTKPKNRKQIFKWLQSPHSDAAEYKMWGNGVALPCVVFVLSGIVYHTQS